MSDQYERLRSLSFRAIASAIGISLQPFKQRKGKHGQELYGPCPFQKQKNNVTSFSYSDSGLWHCFSCNKHGRGAIDFVKELRGGGFRDAIDFLTVIEPLPAKDTTPAPPASPDANSGVLEPLKKDTWRNYQVPCPWLEARIPDAAIRERFGVFCYNNPARKSAYSGRVMIPVKDIKGELFGYLGRDTTPNEDRGDSPKYIFPKNLPKSRFLFGAYELLQSRPKDEHGNEHQPLKIVYLVESPFAVMKFASLGLPAVAAYGWSVSDEQVELLSKLAKGVVYLPDANKREEANAQCHRIAIRLWLKFPPLPELVTDPEYLTKEQILALH